MTVTSCFSFPFSLRVERNGAKWLKEDMDILCRKDYQRSNLLSGELVREKGKVFINPHGEGRKLEFSRSAFLVSFLK